MRQLEIVRDPRAVEVLCHPSGARLWTSVWSGLVRNRQGVRKFRTPLHPNLRVNAGIDWQAGAMEGTPNKGESGTATATAATSLTNSGATFPTTGGGAAGGPIGYVGHIVCAGPNASGTGSTVYGVIVSNTGTVLTIDRWVDAGSPFAAGTTPNATAKYQVLPGQAPSWFMALSTTVQSGAAGDTTLAGEITTGTDSGLARAAYTTLTHTNGVASYSLAKTFTAGSTQTINSEALFNASSTTAAGVMSFESAEPNAPTLVSGDTLAQTVTVSI
jgi:hypothetical protein